MKNRLLYISLFCVTLLVLMPCVSSIGSNYQIKKTTQKQTKYNDFSEKIQIIKVKGEWLTKLYEYIFGCAIGIIFVASGPAMIVVGFAFAPFAYVFAKIAGWGEEVANALMLSFRYLPICWFVFGLHLFKNPEKRGKYYEYDIYDKLMEQLNILEEFLRNYPQEN